MRSLLLTVLFNLFHHTVATYNEYPEQAPEMNSSDRRLDSHLWAHILLMLLSFGVLLPTGMVLGMIRSRLHIPIQIMTIMLALVGYVLGHSHRHPQYGRPNPHSSFAKVIAILLTVQVALGIWLRLHLEKKGGWTGRVSKTGRQVFLIIHGWLGKSFPVIIWVQILLGFIVAVDFCHGDHRPNCRAHMIMGSNLVGFAIVLTMVLVNGQTRLQKTGRSQDFFESILITASGGVNTFTEHRWGTLWTASSVLHTSMGIIWWFGGLLGIYMTFEKNGQQPPARTIVPSMIMILTGWAMSGHPQSTHISEVVHTAFGWALIGAGAARVVEISFLLGDRPADNRIRSWQHLPPLLYCASGLLFIGANEDQMQLLDRLQLQPIAYVLILYSMAFLLYLYVNILISLYSAGSPGNNVLNDRTAFDHLSTTSSSQSHPYKPLREQYADDLQEYELDRIISQESEK